MKPESTTSNLNILVPLSEMIAEIGDDGAIAALSANRASELTEPDYSELAKVSIGWRGF